MCPDDTEVHSSNKQYLQVSNIKDIVRMIVFLLFSFAHLATSHFSFKTQVLIHHNPNLFRPIYASEPDCLGTIIAPKYVVTAASCFMSVNHILRYSEDNVRGPSNEVELRLLLKSVMKKGAKQTRH